MKRLVLGALVLLTACGSDHDFEAAVHANTTTAYDEYLRVHPDGSHAREARARITALVEDRDWERAQTVRTADAYQHYLSAYPTGKHAHDALVAVAELNLARGTTPAVVAPATTAEVPAVEPVAPPPAAKGAIERATTPVRAAALSPPVVAPAAPVAARTAPAAALAAAPTTPAAAAAPRSARRAPARPARAPASPPGDSGAAAPPGYRVQLGAWATGSRPAEGAWHRLASAHPDLAARKPLIAAALSADGRQIYRLQLAGLTRGGAESLCRELQASSEPCIVIGPLSPGRR